jgi:hypothetical protein
MVFCADFNKIPTIGGRRIVSTHFYQLTRAARPAPNADFLRAFGKNEKSAVFSAISFIFSELAKQ